MRRIASSAVCFVTLLGWGCGLIVSELSPEGARVRLVRQGQTRPSLRAYERVGPKPYWLFPITCERNEYYLFGAASEEEMLLDCHNELRNRAAKRWQADLVVITDVNWGSYYDSLEEDYANCWFSRCLQLKAMVYRRKSPPDR